MGVIIRQGIKHSLVNYLGAGVGVISMLFIYPLDAEAYGLARFLTDTAILFIPITLLGANVLPVRFFPTFEDDKNAHNGFLGWLLVLSLVGSLLTVVAAWLAWKPIMDYYGGISPLYRAYLIFFIPILLLRALIQMLISYISNFHRIVIPSLLNDLLFKISLPVFIYLLYKGWWDYQQLVIGIVFNFVFVFLGLILYLRYLGQWSLSINWPAFRGSIIKEMREYGFYGVLGSISSTLAVNLDVFMIGSMISPTATGIYGIASIMANLINRPQIALGLIAAPIIMKAWKENDMAPIAAIYRKSSINALVPGVLIFLLIWLNLGDIYNIMPNSAVISENRDALIYLGLAYLINLLTGVNSEVMIYSRLFKLHFYAVLLLAGMNIILNYILIQRMGITGAAIATLISFVAYNTFKCVVIYRAFAMHPFTKGTLGLVFIAGGIWVTFHYLILTDSSWINLLLRSSLVSLIFVTAVYLFPISEDINQLIRKGLRTANPFAK
jgi:O-antigen/teichoic acid export membrane protein